MVGSPLTLRLYLRRAEVVQEQRGRDEVGRGRLCRREFGKGRKGEDEEGGGAGGGLRITRKREGGTEGRGWGQNQDSDNRYQGNMQSRT